jgi:ABC-type uncharacterized transport system fused permease/ATPase subunit
MEQEQLLKTNFVTAVTPLISFFQVLLSRSTEAAMDLLGENFE